MKKNKRRGWLLYYGLIAGLGVLAPPGKALACPTTSGGTYTVDGAEASVTVDCDISVHVTSSGSITTSLNTAALSYNGQSAGSILNEGLIANPNATPASHTGAVDLIGGSNLFGDITNKGSIQGGSYGVHMSNSTLHGDIVNSGTLTEQGASIRLESSALVDGNIVNNGTMTSVSNGIVVHGGSVTGNIVNNNIISATDNLAAGVLFNATTNPGITNTEIGGLINNGTITAENGNGVEMDTFGTGTNVAVATFSNTGLITGRSGVSLIASGGVLQVNKIVNTGTITGTSAYGLDVEGATVGSITNSGEINGGVKLVVASGLPLSFANSGVVNGNIDLSGADVAAIANDGTINGNINLGDFGTLTLGTGSVTEGTINGNGGASLDVTGDALVMDDVSVGHATIESSGTLTAKGGLAVTSGALNNNGTLQLVAGNTLALTGDYMQGATGRLAVPVVNAGSYGRIDISGNATFAPGTAIFVDLSHLEGVPAQSFSLQVAGAGGTLDAGILAVTDNTPLYSFAPQVVGDSLYLIGTRHNISDIVPGDAATALNSVIAEGSAGSDTVLSALTHLQTTDEIAHAVTETTPQSSPGAGRATLSNYAMMGEIVQARQSPQASSGLSAGDGFTESGHAWFKPFGQWEGQGNRNGLSGYDAESYGLMAGVDGEAGKDWRLGVAFGYANTTVDTRGVSQRVDVDSYQLTGYATKALDRATSLNMQLSGGYNDNDSHRHLSFGGLDTRADAKYGGWAVHTGAGIEHRIDLGADFSFTPQFRADYTRLSTNGYTESGAGALDLHSGRQVAEELTPALEGEIYKKFESGFSASVYGGIGYDVLADGAGVSSSFVGSGTAFSTPGVDPSHWVYRAGAGLGYADHEGNAFTLRYDGEFRPSDYRSNAVSLHARRSF